MNKSIFEIELNCDKYTLLVLNDTLRMLIIQIVVQLLFVIKNDNIELLSDVFVENTLFIILGVLVYWMIFNYIIQFKLKDDEDISNNIFYQKIYS
tara:strand:+ start:61 stop:345 length:285 start_codon:yes stop_codon:yes gene_type:complete